MTTPSPVRASPQVQKSRRRARTVSTRDEQQKPRIPLLAHPQLTVLQQWVNWRLEPRGDGKLTKVPYDPRTGKRASSTDPSTWSCYTDAISAIQKFHGIGIVLSEGDSLTAIDLDNARDPNTGVIEPWAKKIIDRLKSYVEVSPSGTGIHVFVGGKLPPGVRCKRSFETGRIEMYSRARFLTYTGEHLEGTSLRIEPRQPEIDMIHRELFPARVYHAAAEPIDVAPIDASDEEVIERIRTSKHGSKFFRLMNGDISDYAGDDSAADLALCNKLAFWLGKDRSRMDAWFRRSRLMRDKWDSPRGNSTYGVLTIERACEGTSKTYRPRKSGRATRRVTAAPAPPSPEAGGNSKGRDDSRSDAPNMEVTGAPSWRSRLITSERGTPKALLANAIHVLRSAPEWAGVIARDTFAFRTVAVKPTPWGFTGRWTERDDALATDWLQHAGIHVSVDVAARAIETVAEEQPVHPVRNYLDSLEWDGTPRIDTWLHRYTGAEDTEYTRTVGAKWLISAVARVRVPGCKADHALILEGKQGRGKSSASGILGGEFFTDDIADLGTKDSSLQVAGAWIIELGEMAGFGRAEQDRLKAFMSRRVDRFRPPYGRRLIEVPRQSVFLGTVNLSTYLRDETGARRFWPIQCGAIDLKALQRDRDQLWAEAQMRYAGGESWWLSDPEVIQQAAEQQAARYEGDPWQAPIEKWAETRDSISVEDVLQLCLDKPKAQWQQADKNRVARCLNVLGWTRKQIRIGDKREWRYLRES